MPETKSLSGLVLLKGNRLTVNNQNPNLPAISVNGEQLSYQDINLASVRIEEDKALGTLICNELQCDSDRRLKRDICNLDEDRCMNVIQELKPKKYRFKHNDKIRYGLIAQEVKTVLPELVNTSNETMSINYLELIPILIGGMKRM